MLARALAVKFAVKFTTQMLRTLLLLAASTSTALLAQNRSVTLGPGYADDVYYSMNAGVVATVPTANWDLAFAVNPYSVTVRINDGSGLRLYNLQTSLANWASADTAGKMFSPLVNSEHDWSLGAFNRGATGHPNYGWGTYNPVTHDVIGNQVYALRWADGTVKKVAIESMTAMGVVSVRVANLDGSGQQTITASKSAFSGKQFGYLNLQTGQSLDREPALGTYDLVLGKYVSLLPGNVPYSVTGVRSAPGVRTVRATNVDTNNVDLNAWALQDSSAAAIGYDWKTFVMSTFSWNLADSTAYLVQPSASSPIYQIVFKTFGGSSTGSIGFAQREVSSLNHAEPAQIRVVAYPNPGRGTLNVDLKADAEVKLLTLDGRLCYSWNGTAGTNSWSTASLPAGSYVILVLDPAQPTAIRWQCL